MSNDKAPKLTIELEPEQKRKLEQYIPWGMQSALFRVIVDDLITMFERGNAEVLTSAIITRRINLNDIIQPSDGKHRQSKT